MSEERWGHELVLLQQGKSLLNLSGKAASESLAALQKAHHDKKFPKSEGWWESFAHWSNCNDTRKAVISIGLEDYFYQYVGDLQDVTDNRLDWPSIMKHILRVKRIIFTREREFNYDYDAQILD